MFKDLKVEMQESMRKEYTVIRDYRRMLKRSNAPKRMIDSFLKSSVSSCHSKVKTHVEFFERFESMNQIRFETSNKVVYYSKVSLLGERGNINSFYSSVRTEIGYRSDLKYRLFNIRHAKMPDGRYLVRAEYRVV